MNEIVRVKVRTKDRTDVAHALFGIQFPMRLEPTVYGFAGNIASEYNGGHWEFYRLDNGGFYMAPSSDTPFKVRCENGFEGTLSADALGITACLYTYSHLSFGEGEFAETCARHYHLLRDWMFEQPEVRQILRAID